MPLKPYAIDAIHLFLSGWPLLQEVVIEKMCFLCTGWIYATIIKRKKTDIEP